MSDNIERSSSWRDKVKESTLVQVQAVSGLMVGSYLTLHLTNVALANFGPFAFNMALNIFRELYQHPAFEIPLVLSIPAHLIASSIRSNRRNKRQEASVHKTEKKELTFTEKQLYYHRIAAKYLAVAIFAHFAGTRINSLIAGLHPSFSFISLTMTWPSILFYFPYYCMLGLSGGYHFVNGVYYALRNLGQRRLLPKHADKIAFVTGTTVGVIAVGAVISFAGFTGHHDSSSWAAWNMAYSLYPQYLKNIFRR